MIIIFIIFSIIIIIIIIIIIVVFVVVVVVVIVVVVRFDILHRSLLHQLDLAAEVVSFCCFGALNHGIVFLIITIIIVVIRSSNSQCHSF